MVATAVGLRGVCRPVLGAARAPAPTASAIGALLFRRGAASAAANFGKSKVVESAADAAEAAAEAAAAAAAEAVGAAAAEAVGAAAGAASAVASAVESLTDPALAAVEASTGASFWSLMFAFVCGGLFFSTAVVLVGGVVAFGKNNVQRALTLTGLVLRSVGSLVWDVFAAARRALLADVGAALGWDVRKYGWGEAWAVLKEGFALGRAENPIRRAAAEGVEALRQEANLYAAAVGVPGLPLQQYMLDRLLPLYYGELLGEALGGALRDVKVEGRVRRMELRKFEVGDTAPRLISARAYDLGAEAMAFDVELDWQSEATAEIDVVTTAVGARVPMTAANFGFAGALRLVVANLTTAAPGYGALLVSMPTAPKIGLDLRVAGAKVSELPWLRGELETTIQNAMEENMLWPRRVVVPAEKTKAKDAVLPVLNKRTLEELQHDDPLLRAERALAQQPALKSGALAGATDSFAASGPAAAPALDIFVGDPAGGRPLAAPGKTRTAEARALLARTLGLAFRLAGRSGLKVADLAAGSLRRRWM